jgi:pimeloyl-ACP methyl ester carboxylesterase
VSTRWSDLTHHRRTGNLGYYFKDGVESTALVFIHGMGGSSQQWRTLLPLLPAGSPLVLIDLPWHGTSRGYQGRLDRAEVTGAVAHCIANAWPGEAVIVAHSIASYFGWSLAELIGTRIRGGVIVSGHLFSISELLAHGRGSLHLRFVLADSALKASIAPPRPLRTGLNRSGLLRHLLLRPQMSPAALTDHSRVGDCFEHTGGVGALRLLTMARRIELHEVARASTVPMALVYGARDPLLTAKDAQLVTRLPHLQAAHRVTGVGHMIESPEAVNAAIRTQIAPKPPTGSRGRSPN